MVGKLPITLLSAAAWTMLAYAAPADPTITPPPVLPRQLEQAFIGFLEVNNTYISQACDPGLVWYVDGDYGQCCPETLASCPAPTACIRGSQIYPFGTTTTTIACTENYNNTAASICNTAFIYESFGDPNPKTDIICGDSSVNWSYFRKVPASATEITSKSSTSTLGPAVVITTTPTPSGSGGGGSKSKAWIAGAVVGPIIGIALIAGIVFFFVRRNSQKKKEEATATAAIPQVGGASMGPPPGVTDAKPQMSTHNSYAQTPGTTFNPNDPYNQQGFAVAPVSPAPQYSQPYPPPRDPSQAGYAGAYAPEKNAYTPAAPQPQAAELGGSSMATPQPAAGSHATELPAEAKR